MAFAASVIHALTRQAPDERNEPHEVDTHRVYFESQTYIDLFGLNAFSFG